MKIFNWVVLVLVLVGGLNWGLIGLLNYNLVEALFGSMPTLVNIVYDLVGLSALYLIFVSPKLMKQLW